jgi:hypothetical protein
MLRALMGETLVGCTQNTAIVPAGEVTPMKKSAIKLGDEWHECELAVPPGLKSVTADDDAEWVKPQRQGSIELVVSKELEIPNGNYLLRLNEREMLFRVTMQKLQHVWGDAVSSSSQYSV